MSVPDTKTIMLASASKQAAEEVQASLASVASSDPAEGSKTPSGTATILNGTTSIAAGTFAGLDGSPVQLTFAEAPTAAAKLWYVWDGSDQLTIHIDADNTADIAVAYAVDGR